MQVEKSFLPRDNVGYLDARGRKFATVSAAATPTIVVYGLSTEGYRLASSMAIKGAKVSLVDESVRMAIALKPDIARTYPDVGALREDEPLLDLEPFENSISNASYLFFAPRVRKVGADARADVSSKFRDAVKSLRKGSSVVYMLPVGLGGNAENIQIVEHVTGMTVSDGKDISYYYMPQSIVSVQTDFTMGSVKGKQDNILAKMLHDSEIRKKISFADLNSNELTHVIKVLGHYSGVAGVLEVCKRANPDQITRSPTFDWNLGELYIDDATNGLYDLRTIASSLDGGGPLAYLVNGSIRGIEGYLKYLIDNLRGLLKRQELKASRTRVSVAWSLDPNEMRGDKIELLGILEDRIRDYIGDVERQQAPGFDPYNHDKTLIILACSKLDYERQSSRKTSGSSDYIIMKANPLCQTFVHK